MILQWKNEDENFFTSRRKHFLRLKVICGESLIQGGFKNTSFVHFISPVNCLGRLKGVWFEKIHTTAFHPKTEVWYRLYKTTHTILLLPYIISSTCTQWMVQQSATIKICLRASGIFYFNSDLHPIVLYMPRTMYKG